jgi:hypothetical protein
MSKVTTLTIGETTEEAKDVIQSVLDCDYDEIEQDTMRTYASVSQYGPGEVPSGRVQALREDLSVIGYDTMAVLISASDTNMEAEYYVFRNNGDEAEVTENGFERPANAGRGIATNTYFADGGEYSFNPKAPF